MKETPRIRPPQRMKTRPILWMVFVLNHQQRLVEKHLFRFELGNRVLFNRSSLILGVPLEPRYI